MSYFECVCPKCDQRYMFGVVGTTILGGHDCPRLVITEPTTAQIEQLREEFGEDRLVEI
jgi:hypothetical protein